MTTTEEIAIKLGLKVGDLKAALAEANADVKVFGQQGAAHAEGFTEAIHGTHKAMRLFHQFLVGGGILEVIKKFYETAIAYAEKHTELTDEQTEAVRRFAHEIEHTKDGFASFVTQGLGWLNRFGEAWGSVIGAVIYGLKESQTAQEINMAAEENLEELAKKRKETLKEIEATEKEVAGAQAALAKAEFEQLSTREKVAQLTTELQEKFELLNTTEETSLVHAKTKVEILKLQATAMKVLADERKEEEDKEQNWIDYVRTSKELALDREDREYKEREEQAVKARAEQEKFNAEVLRAAEAYRLVGEAVRGVSEEIITATAKSESFIAQWEGFTQSLQHTGGSVTSLSDVQLNALISRLNSEIASAKAAAFGPTGHPDDLRFNPYYQQGQLSLQAATAERDLRSNFRQTVSFFGQEKAEQDFAPADYNRLLQYLNPDQAKAQANDIAGIASTLKQLFPRQATAIAR